MRAHWVLGAGAQPRAVVWALLRGAGASQVSVRNRTPTSVPQALARHARRGATGGPQAPDLLVNCTSVGLGPRGTRRHFRAPASARQTGPRTSSATEDRALNQLGLTFDQVGEYSYVVDMVYRTGSTPLLAAAREHGARTLDGLEILVAQGALSFERWTDGRRPAAHGRCGARSGVPLETRPCGRRFGRDERLPADRPDLHAIFAIDGEPDGGAPVISVERGRRGGSDGDARVDHELGGSSAPESGSSPPRRRDLETTTTGRRRSVRARRPQDGPASEPEPSPPAAEPGPWSGHHPTVPVAAPRRAS